MHFLAYSSIDSNTHDHWWFEKMFRLHIQPRKKTWQKHSDISHHCQFGHVPLGICGNQKFHLHERQEELLWWGFLHHCWSHVFTINHFLPFSFICGNGWYLVISLQAWLSSLNKSTNNTLVITQLQNKDRKKVLVVLSVCTLVQITSGGTKDAFCSGH